MSDRSVSISTSGPPETILPEEPAELRHALARAAGVTHPEARRAAVAEVVAAHPRSLSAWATLAPLGRDEVERYACFRVGYHRGLDTLRANGWRGSGYVRWEHPTNRAFLRCLDGLRAAATAIDEADEAERCALFLQQLDPSWPPADLD